MNKSVCFWMCILKTQPLTLTHINFENNFYEWLFVNLCKFCDGFLSCFCVILIISIIPLSQAWFKLIESFWSNFDEFENLVLLYCSNIFQEYHRVFVICINIIRIASLFGTFDYQNGTFLNWFFDIVCTSRRVNAFFFCGD